MTDRTPRPSTLKKIKRVRALVNKGSRISDALKATGTPPSQWHQYKNYGRSEPVKTEAKKTVKTTQAKTPGKLVAVVGTPEEVAKFITSYKA